MTNACLFYLLSSVFTVKHHIHRRFNLYNDILLFLDKVGPEYKKHGISYNVDIIFSSILNDYKVIISV